MADPDNERLELYKLSVEMADRVSARRVTANTFFLTLETLLAGLVAIVGPPSTSVPLKTGMVPAVEADTFGIVMACIVGVVLSAAWLLLLRSYRDLNEAKFEVILAMEKELSAQPFGDEWEHLKKDPVKPLKDRYAELGVVERVVPIVFSVVYVIIGARAVWS